MYQGRSTLHRGEERSLVERLADRASDQHDALAECRILHAEGDGVADRAVAYAASSISVGLTR